MVMCHVDQPEYLILAPPILYCYLRNNLHGPWSQNGNRILVAGVTAPNWPLLSGDQLLENENLRWKLFRRIIIIYIYYCYSNM